VLPSGLFSGLLTGLFTVLLTGLFTGLLTGLFTGLLIALFAGLLAVSFAGLRTGLLTASYSGSFVQHLPATVFSGRHKRMLGMFQRKSGDFLACRQTQQQSCRLRT